MGFEIQYSFYEKSGEDYNKDEIKSFKKRVGDPFEDVPLDKLATMIIAQLARRDIFISDVEIYELSKKNVSFKETKGGIVIKNKKFLFDSAEGSLTCVDETPTVEASSVINNSSSCEVLGEPSNLSCSKAALQPHEILNPAPRRVIESVVFSPEAPQAQEIRSKNLKLTIDKKYDVFEKRPSPNGLGDLYLILDDKNKEQWVSDLYFVPSNINLFGDKELGFSDGPERSEGGKLLWGDASVDSSMPNIRRR
jgi:hypothetical protein